MKKPPIEPAVGKGRLVPFAILFWRNYCSHFHKNLIPNGGLCDGSDTSHTESNKKLSQWLKE